MIVFERKNYTFTYDKEKKFLCQNWKGFVDAKGFQEAIDALVELAKQYKISYVLSDVREGSILKRESTNYAASVMPKLISLGLKKMAFLLPEKIFVELSVNNFTNQAVQKVPEDSVVRNFGTMEKAKSWLFE